MSLVFPLAAYFPLGVDLRVWKKAPLMANLIQPIWDHMPEPRRIPVGGEQKLQSGGCRVEPGEWREEAAPGRAYN